MDTLEQTKGLDPEALRREEAALTAAGTDGSADLDAIHGCIALRCLALHQGLLLRDPVSVREDWERILQLLAQRTDKPITDALRRDALALVLLPDPGCKRKLLRQLPPEHRMPRSPREMSDTLRSIIIGEIRFCLDTDRLTQADAMVQNSAKLSLELQGGNTDEHRRMVSTLMFLTVETLPRTARAVGKEHQRYFDQVQSYDSRRFHWFHAVVTLNCGEEEAAYPLLQSCRDLWWDYEGESSWIGSRCEIMLQEVKLLSPQPGDSEAFLWDALDKIDSFDYIGMDQEAPVVRAHVLSLLLKYHVDHQTIGGWYPRIMELLQYCEEHTGTVRQSILTVRFARNLLSAYYMAHGQYLQAALEIHKALEQQPPHPLAKNPSDLMLYTNLLLVYIHLNDHEQMEHCIQVLQSMESEYRDNETDWFRVNLMIKAARERISGCHQEGDEDFRVLDDFYRRMIRHTLRPAKETQENLNRSQWILDCINRVLDNHTADRKQLLRYRQIVRHFLDNPKIYPLRDTQMALCLMILAHADFQLEDPAVIPHLRQCLEYADTISPYLDVRTAVFRFAGLVYYNLGMPEEAVQTMDKGLTTMEATWHNATAYLSDQRVGQLLYYTQQYFECCCYGVLRLVQSSLQTYEQLLRFKDLPALAARERSRILRRWPLGRQVMEQLFELQDQLAAAELNADSREVERLNAAIRPLETQIEKEFPRHQDFTPISWEGVCRHLQEGDGILEYCFTPGAASLDMRSGEEDWELDLFVTVKTGGSARLHHLRLEVNDELLLQMEQLLSLICDPQDIYAEQKKQELRSALYRHLVEPAMPFLGEISRLYIAPDVQLCLLPFELLPDSRGRLLQDRFQICRLVSGRDLLFEEAAADAGDRSFILGDPDYDLAPPGGTTRSQMGQTVCSLPFSGIEARQVATLCGSRAHQGASATKYALQAALPCRIIHIATHGAYDADDALDPLYASYLIFAGYNRYAVQGDELPGCGNGILTADEISRMDLSASELVVLSACHSSMGDISRGSIRGLLSAFCAAGARWVVSHLWEANDFATAVLMRAFYEAYLNGGMEVPEALGYAKQYLRTVTVGQLRRNGWLEPPEDRRISQQQLQEIRRLAAAPDRWKPFEDEYYWGGFTVHQGRR